MKRLFFYAAAVTALGTGSGFAASCGSAQGACEAAPAAACTVVVIGDRLTQSGNCGAIDVSASVNGAMAVGHGAPQPVSYVQSTSSVQAAPYVQSAPMDYSQSGAIPMTTLGPVQTYGSQSVSYSEPQMVAAHSGGAYQVQPVAAAAPVVATVEVVSEPAPGQVIFQPEVFRNGASGGYVGAGYAAGWAPRVFVGASAGYAHTSKVSIGAEVQDPAYRAAYPTDASRSADVGAKGGWSAGVHVGVEFAPGWRAKVEYQRIQNKVDDSASYNYVGLFSDDARFTANAGFLSVEKAFDLGGLRPYIGAGAGYISLDAHANNTDPANGFGYKLIAGAEVPISDALSLFGEYNFVSGPSLKTQGNGVEYKIDYKAHVVNPGLRLSFY